MENIIEKLNLSIELINKRKILKENVNELSQYNDYLNTPQVDFKIYKANNKIVAASVFRVISNVIAVMGIIMIISYYASMAGIFWLVIAAILGTIATTIKKSKYQEYIRQDNQYRSMCQSKLVEYQKAVEELNSLELYMSNTQVCVIPKDYWDNALEISGYIRNGMATTVEEAINLLPSKIKEINNIIFCQNCGTQNTTAGSFCVKCGKKLI